MSLTSPNRNFCALLAASLLIWWHVLSTTFNLALRNDAYTHILLIIPISVTLIILGRRKHAWEPAPSILAGSALLVLAVMIGGLGSTKMGIFTGDIRLAIEMLAVVVWWIGSFMFCFGGQVFRRTVFPLLFLLWLIPLPGFALNHVVELLQQDTASCARELFTIIGVPVTQNGTALTVPGLTVEVAQECSSIRSSMVLIVTTTVMSYLLLRSFWGRTIVILAAVPLSVAKNGLRVFTLAGLGAYVNSAILSSPLHHQGGVLFLAVALVAVFALIAIIGRVERKRASTIEAMLPRLSTLGIK